MISSLPPMANNWQGVHLAPPQTQYAWQQQPTGLQPQPQPTNFPHSLQPNFQLSPQPTHFQLPPQPTSVRLSPQHFHTSVQQTNFQLPSPHTNFQHLPQPTNFQQTNFNLPGNFQASSLQNTLGRNVGAYLGPRVTPIPEHSFHAPNTLEGGHAATQRSSAVSEHISRAREKPTTTFASAVVPRRRGNQRPMVLTLEFLTPYFGQSLEAVSDKLGLSRSTIKAVVPHSPRDSAIQHFPAPPPPIPDPPRSSPIHPRLFPLCLLPPPSWNSCSLYLPAVPTGVPCS